MRVERSWTPAERDRAARRLRTLTWGVAIASAGATAGLSAVAAHAFKGHSAKPAAVARRTAPRRTPAVARVSVPGPQQVPAIAGQPAALQPPDAPPQTPQTPPPAAETAPPPPVSGGS